MLAQVYIRYTQDFEKGSRDSNIKERNKASSQLKPIRNSFQQQRISISFLPIHILFQDDAIILLERKDMASMER